MPLEQSSETDARIALAFGDISAETLDGLSPAVVDALPYGVVGLAADGTVAVYNATEARLASINPGSVRGVHFFSEVGQCMNNFMVAQRFEDEPELDAQLDYVLTLRMRPTPVRLRLLRTPAIKQRYILILR